LELLPPIAQLTKLHQLSLHQMPLVFRPIDDDDYDGYGSASQQDWEEPSEGSGSRRSTTHLQPLSALTASDHLERLELVFRDSDVYPPGKAQPLQLHGFQYIFPPGRQLLGLTELVVEAFGPETDAWAESWADDFQEMLLRGRDLNGLESTACLTARDIKRIAFCCPNLKRLTLNGVVEVEYEHAVAKSFRAVQRQLQLTHLCLGGPWLTNNTAAVIAGMTSLHSLQLHNAPVLMANGLERLTALQQLQELQLNHVGPQRGNDFCFEADAEVSIGGSCMHW
jgi:hypothetical protein